MSSRPLALALLFGCCAAGCGGLFDGKDDAERIATGSVAGSAVTGIRYLGGSSGTDAGTGSGEAGTVRFLRAEAPREFVFPADHGSHPEFRTEWWYFTGNLSAAADRHFGFEVTFFRIGIGSRRRAGESAWASDQIWMAHFALTDTANRKFRTAERLSRGALDLAGADSDPFAVWVEDWSVRAAPGGGLVLRAQSDDAAVDLELSGLERIVLQGDLGLDPKGPAPGNASYYYSAPRLHVHGSVRSGSESAMTVNGSAWLDREWSTSALSAGIAGWDWFALQLDDGRDLMFYRLRGADGSTSPFSSGSLTDAGGKVRRLLAADVELIATEHWRSPGTGVVYPVGWHMRVPAIELDLLVEPYLPQQEIDLSVRYWEGAVRIGGRSGEEAVGGAGYLELAGY